MNGFDPVRQLDQEIALEQRHLKLRELHNTQDELDRHAKARELERQREADREAEAKRTAEREQQSRRQQEIDAQRLQDERARAKQQRARRHRDAIQDTKDTVIHRWYLIAFVSSSLRAQMLTEIEQTLSPLPVEDLPPDELVRIAEGIRDRLYAEAQKEKNEARDREQKEWVRERERNQRRMTLIRHGRDYAARALRDVEGLDFFERRDIEQRIARALDDIAGDETTDDIEDLVEDILEREGIGYEDEDDD